MNIPILRKEVRNIVKATASGLSNFQNMAKLHGSEVKRVHYRDICPVSDVMAIETATSRLVLTEQNLQYFPAKVRFFYVKHH